MNSNVELKCWIEILNWNVKFKCWIEMLNWNVELKCWIEMLNWIVELKYWIEMFNFLQYETQGTLPGAPPFFCYVVSLHSHALLVLYFLLKGNSSLTQPATDTQPEISPILIVFEIMSVLIASIDHWSFWSCLRVILISEGTQKALLESIILPIILQNQY